MKKNFVSLAEARPDLAKEWNYEKNGDLKPEDVSCGSNKKVWWKLPYDVPDDYPVEHLREKHFEFEWEASTGDRTRGVNCPFLCQNPKTWKGFNDLATTNPSLAGEWDYKLNIGLTPSDVTANSGKNVWWHLQYDIPNDYMVENLRGKRVDFRWQAAVSDRNNGNGCPFLSGKAVWPGFNDLRTTNPELAKQWHPTKNGELTAVQVTASSNKKIWWLLPYDVPMEYSIKHLRGKHFDFEWQTTINHRTGNYGTRCPYLNGKAVWPGFNDLQTTNPELAKQWHPTKNGELTAVQVTASSNKKVWWLYPYDDPKTGKHFDFEWEAIVSSRNKGTGCPFLTGKAVWPGFNDLQTVNPSLAKLWHPTKNGKLKPTQVTINSTKRVWWMYPYDDLKTGKHFDFEWQSSIVTQNISKHYCPYLSNQAIWKGFNDLQTINPRLASQWHPTKNGNLKPEQVTFGSRRKVWWLLPYDDKKTGIHYDFEWQASISKRARGVNCPFLITYRGENYIKQYLQKNNISFNTQKKFSDLFGIGDGQLSYDFSISDEKHKYILIEYNGIQHYEANDYFGGEEQFKKQKEHDKRKRNYAKKHGYKLITIKYTYDTYESVEEYLDKEFEKLGVINDSVNLCSPSPDVDGVSDSPYTSSNHQTDGQPKIGHGFPSIDDTKKEESVNDAA